MTNKQQADLIIHARWIIPMDKTRSILEDHAIVIHHGHVEGIFPRDKNPYTSSNTLDKSNHIVMPGLINAHTHAAMTLFRGLADDLPLMEWLNDHIWPAEHKWVNEQFIHDGTQLAMAEMIRGGTTCFSDMYFFPNIAAQAANEAHMRATMNFPVLDFPSAWAQDANEYLEKGLALHDAYRNHDLINIDFGPHAPYTVSDEPFQRIATVSAQTGMGIQIHLHETAHEVDEAIQQNGQRPLQRLDQLNLLTPQLQAVHMTQLTDEEIALLAKTGVHVIHCPESNLKLASGFCPVGKLLQAGVNVALGTDGAASNNDLDMFSEMRTAALLAKGVSGNPATVPAMQALEMATINGAKALGIADVTGSLEPGKFADMIAITLNAPETQPHYHPAAQLAYATTADKVTDSWVAGHQLMKDRKLTTLNTTDILARAAQWQTKIAGTDQGAHHDN